MVLAMSLVFASQAGVSAKEYNQRPHLDPGSQAKVNSVIAGNLKDRTSDTDQSDSSINNSCGDLKIGNVDDSKRPPREIIIVAKDIINVGSNC